MAENGAYGLVSTIPRKKGEYFLVVVVSVEFSLIEST